MNNDIDLKKTEKMGYISYWCQKVIPLVFDDSLSYYEAICKFMQKLNEVIKALNNNALCIDELQDKYIILQKNFDTLEEEWKAFQTKITKQQTDFETTINDEFNSFKTYVENYLDNIDVASFVNTKIDEMVASGEFNTLIENALSSLVAGNGIKIENGTISTTNYKATNIYSGIKTDMIQVGSTTNVKENLSNNSIGYNNKFTDGTNNILLGSNNNVSKNNNHIIGDNNNVTSEETICIGNFLKPQLGQIVIGKYNLSQRPYNATIIGNGNDENNRHNAIVIPSGTTTPISINQEVNCSDNFITRTFVEGDNVDTIYAEKPNGLVNASEVKASIDPLITQYEELNDRTQQNEENISNLSQEIGGIASNTAIDYTLTFNNDIVTNIIRNSNYKYLFNGYKYTNTTGEPVEDVIYGYFNIVLEYSFTDDLNVAKLFTRAIGGAEELNSIIGIWKENENSTTECYPCVINCRENSSTHDIEYMLVTNINGQIRKSGRIEIKGIL